MKLLYQHSLIWRSYHRERKDPTFVCVVLYASGCRSIRSANGGKGKATDASSARMESVAASSVDDGMEAVEVYNNPTFGNLLRTSAEISERILSYMNCRQLCVCAQVCSLWNTTAKRLNSKRSSVVHCFEPLKRKRKVCSRGEHSRDFSGNATKSFIQSMTDAWSEPGRALVFGTQYLYRYLSPPQKASPVNSHRVACWSEVTQRVASLLPPPCFLLLGTAGGVIGTNASGCPIELERGEGVSGMLLPARLPEGVRAQPFLVRRDHVSPENRPSDWFATDMFKSLVGLPVGEEAVDVKCVLWFTVSDVAFGENYQLMYDMVTDVVASCGMRRFALGGAVLEQMTVNNGLNGIDHSILCAGLCFSGDSVRAASKIVAPSVKGAEAVERELAKFRLDTGFDGWDKSCTFGFMFACVARGARHHGKTNVEADAFARVFPGVPLMGVFGNGEIGVNYVPTDQQLLAPVSRKENCFHGYTTVFVLLSWSKCR
ncbi:F-box only protein 22-like [Dermacentor andersoni]|uniref:F-box only protein 22-like n=1 Tax=Dermacentor andersoni TaxID=34620 RepID=UPI002417048F|nr:F-box only protein 22-like [Dermacentor andersoni]